jgi:uncharacterized membrane protein YozB (DUF420 family)
VIALLAAGAHPLVHLNAALNLLATLLLALGLWQVKRRREAAHGRIMIAALATSAAFLTSYLTYHFAVQLTVRFTHPGPVKWVYYAILLSHVLLAITVPFLAITACGPSDGAGRRPSRLRKGPYLGPNTFASSAGRIRSGCMSR